MPSGTTRDLWRRIRWLALALGVALTYGVAGYMTLFGWSFLDALYMTVTTFTTVGFREVRPLGQAGQAFTLSLIVLGVGIVLITIAVTAQWVVDGTWHERSRRRRMQRRIDRMSDHVIVCAYGRVGRAVARELEAGGVAFVVLDPNEDLVERLDEDGVVYLQEDPSDEDVLRRAGVERARALVCAVDSDATNVYISLTARSINPRLFIVARASEPGSDARLVKAGADRVVSPFVSSGRHMARVALRPSVADVLELGMAGAPSLELDEVEVEAGDAGRTLVEAFTDRPVLAIRRADGRVIANPPPDTATQAGDVVVLLAPER